MRRLIRKFQTIENVDLFNFIKPVVILIISISIAKIGQNDA